MATDRVALEQQQRTITQSVCFPAILGIMRAVHRQENVRETEPGVAKISFAKVKKRLFVHTLIHSCVPFLNDNFFSTLL